MTTRIIMRNDGRATAEGETEIFGTNGAQTVTILDGATVTFRSGFNTGGDTIRINGRASDFTASISGSNVTLRSTVDDITVIIPIGTTANTIVFDNGDSRSLSLVGGVPTLGAQTITAAGVPVTAGPGTFTIAGDASANEGGVITYTVTRTDTTSAETLLFSVDGSTNGGVVAAATQGVDFTPASGVVTFAAGAATATFTVAVSADAAVEGLEGFSVRVIKDGAVVASTNATIIDGDAQSASSDLSTGADTINGTGGNDIISGRISEFQSFDDVDGGAGEDTLVLTGTLPTDFQAQPTQVVDAAFAGTTNVERLILAGGTGAILGIGPIAPVNAVLGTLAADAGLTEVVAGGATGAGQTFDVRLFDAALTVTGSANNETVLVNLGTNGAKTLNLDTGLDTVNVTPISNATGSVQVNFTSGAVGNGTNDTVTIVSPNGNVTVNDEGTILQAAGNASVFNVVGLAADGTVDPAQNRGNFGRVELGTGAGDAFETDEGVTLSTYFNGGAGNDTFDVVAQATERHFAVGGGGDDEFDLTNNGAIEVIGGDGDDEVFVLGGNGSEVMNLGAGDDYVEYTGGALRLKSDVLAPFRDTINGGDGIDTLAAGFNTLFFDNANVVGASRLSNFEVLEITNDLISNELFLSGLQSTPLSTVTTFVEFNGGRITFNGAMSTLNLGVAQGLGAINVRTEGTGTADQVTIKADTLANLNGTAQNAFGNRTVNSLGVETLVIDTSAGGTGTRQTINGINMTATGTALTTVEFAGNKSVTAGQINARRVDASDLTGSASLTATTTDANAPGGAQNVLIGSGGNDVITLGDASANVNLGAGNDTLVIEDVNDLDTGSSNLVGGDGIDTLVMDTDVAEFLSVTNIFNAGNSGFEVLSLNRQAQGPANGPGVVETIRVDNIGTEVNKVISAGTAFGTPGTGSAEVVTFEVRELASGQSITISQPGGAPSVTYTNNSGASQSSITVANGIAALFNGLAPAAGSLDEQFNATAVGGGGTGPATVTLTGTTFDNLLDVAVSVNNAALVNPTFANTQGVNPTPAVAEVTTLVLDDGVAAATFTADRIGNDDVTFNGKNGASFVLSSVVDLSGETPELANAIKAAADSDVDWFAQYTTTVVGNNVVFTAKAGGVATDITIVDPVTFGLFGVPTNQENLRGETLTVTTPGADLVPGTAEVTTVTWQALRQGQSVEVAGRKVTATDGDLTAAQVADAFEAGQNGLIVTFPAFGNAQVSGTLVGWTLGAGAATTTVFTSTAAADLTQTQNVTDLSNSLGTTTAPLQLTPTVNNTAGELPGSIGPAGTLILQNLESGDTLEITGQSDGTHEVRVTGSGLSLTDVFNLELTNSTAGGLGYGTIVIDNVETVNITTKDTGAAGPGGALGNAAATQDFVILDLDEATELTVSGNNGLFITGFAPELVLFDASGVVGNAGDTRANLGVVFFSDNFDADAEVTMIGGIGNDFLFGTLADDTYILTQGGADYVQFDSNLASNGFDRVIGFTGGTNANQGKDTLDLDANNLVDGNGGSAGVIFNATTSNTVGDLTLTGFNSNIYLVTDGGAEINLANIKDSTAATGLNGEILLTNGSSAYVLHAASAGSNTFTVYRVFDGNGFAAGVDVDVEKLGEVEMTNTFGNLTVDNFNNTTPTQDPLTAADVAAVTPPAPAPMMMGMLDNVASFSVV